MTASSHRDTMALAADFEPVSHEQWQLMVAKVVNRSRAEALDGPEAEASLQTTLPGGLVVDPLYRRPEAEGALGLPGSMPFTRGRGPRSPQRPWDVRQLFDNPDVATSRSAVTADLANGVSSVWLQVGTGGIAAADVAEVLTEVLADVAPVAVSSVDDQAGAASALLAWWEDKGVPGAGSLGHDPIGAAAAMGTDPDLAPLAEAVAAVAERPEVRAITVDTRIYHDAGATDQDEVALAIATGVDYVRHLEAAGVEAEQAFAAIDFRVAVTADQFATIAKLRALRRLWARVGELAEVPESERGAAIHAVTSWRMQTRTDPWVNILRGTLACFGASAGGADAITVLPYDTALGLAEPFSRRVARNTQSLLADESNVARVADPAGGSWYVESLTDQIAQAAWSLLGEVDAAGGAAAALASGLIAERLAASRAERDRGLATRAIPLTGTSTFPLAGEKPLHRTAREPLPSGGLPRHRDGEIFEALRARAEDAGATPSVPVLALGTRRDFGARQTFLANLLAVGGISAEVIEGADAEAAAGLPASPLAIILSSPKVYAEQAEGVIAALRAHDGIDRVLITGRARELGEDAGSVDGEIYDGMDIVAFLSDLLDTLTGQGA